MAPLGVRQASRLELAARHGVVGGDVRAVVRRGQACATGCVCCGLGREFGLL